MLRREEIAPVATKKTAKKKPAKLELSARGKLAAMKKTSKKKAGVSDNLPRNSRWASPLTKRQQ